MVSPGLAAAMSDRRVPLEPSSAALVTVSVLGTVRSSSASNRGTNRGDLPARPRGWVPRFGEESREANMGVSGWGSAKGQGGTVSGAQTVRRGGAGPGVVAVAALA